MITAVVTVIREDEVEPDALLFVAANQAALDALLDRFYTDLHAQGNFIATTHTGLLPVANLDGAEAAALGFRD